MKRKILLVAGARPNFMKIAPIYRELKRRNNHFTPIIVHTGQHYDVNMSENIFVDLDLPKPDIFLGVGSGTHAEQTAKIMITFENVCIKEKPQMVVVVGDVNSTMACAITSAKLNIPVAHVEAGLRSGDKTMPEEINRLVTDSISDLLLTPSGDANENLLKEGHQKNKITLVGNVMIDSLEYIKSKALRSDIKQKVNVKSQNFALLTMHRPSNVDNPRLLYRILEILARVSNEVPLVFPVHPRTKLVLGKNGVLNNELFKRIYFIDPLRYLDFMNLLIAAKYVITDSGGVQEETTYLGIPCLTLRKNTERPITVTEGTNVLVNLETIESYIIKILNDEWKKGNVPLMWDGKTAERVVDTLVNYG